MDFTAFAVRRNEKSRLCEVGSGKIKSSHHALPYLTLAALVLGNPAIAAETTSYEYDAQGRLIKSSKVGGPANGKKKCTNYDPAGNRTNQTVTSASCSGGSGGGGGGGNNPPIAVNDGGIISCIPNGYYVMANDSDPDGNPISLVSVSGSLNPYISGNIVYVSGTTQGGTYNVYYTIQDSNGATASATLILTWGTHPSCGGGGGGGPEQ